MCSVANNPVLNIHTESPVLSVCPPAAADVLSAQPTLPPPYIMVSPQIYLQENFGPQFAHLQAANNSLFGRAYWHYAHYTILAQVCSLSGLDINKPSLLVHLQTSQHGPGLLLRHNDVVQWARIQWGSFTNSKRVILQAERACTALHSSTILFLRRNKV
jgi:hypothetical protein